LTYIKEASEVFANHARRGGTVLDLIAFGH